MNGSQPLPGLLAHLAPVLDHYGYLAVGGFVTLEDFGVPVPGETILIAAAVYAGAGRLNIIVVALIAFLGAVIGDNIGFAVGFFGGRALVLRFGKYVGLTSARLDKAEGFFGRYALAAVCRLQRSGRRLVGRCLGVRRLHGRRQHHRHLQRGQPLPAVPADRAGGGRGRTDHPRCGPPEAAGAVEGQSSRMITWPAPATGMDSNAATKPPEMPPIQLPSDAPARTETSTSKANSPLSAPRPKVFTKLAVSSRNQLQGVRARSGRGDG